MATVSLKSLFLLGTGENRGLSSKLTRPVLVFFFSTGEKRIAFDFCLFGSKCEILELLILFLRIRMLEPHVLEEERISTHHQELLAELLC